MTSYSSSLEYLGGTKSDADYIYYNGSIINYRSSDLTSGITIPDPPARFNETRDTSIISDASKYNFSIVRFQMDGPNRNLPLFIPDIQENQPNVNLTSYGVVMSFQQEWITALGLQSFQITPQQTFVTWSPEIINSVLAPTPSSPVVRQDLTSQYYWCKTYDHWLQQCNLALQANWASNAASVWGLWQAEWIARGLPGAGDPFPYPTVQDFLQAYPSPIIEFNPTTNLFSIQATSDCFGQRVLPFTPIPYAPGVPQPLNPPSARLFFNSNMAGLFANFQSLYFNSTNIPGLGPVPVGYVQEILFPNRNYSNIVDTRQPPYSLYVPAKDQHVYWVNTQDYPSNDTLWSPVSAVVFTTTLLPIRSEQNSAPVLIGDSNTGGSLPTSQSAFSPIITDIQLPLGGEGAQGWRQFLYYTPSAEYRMADFGPSRQEIRNIDVQIFWRNKLDNELYPLTIPNGGTVSFKAMFRHRGVGS